MIVTASEFRTNVGKYLQLAGTHDIYITKNGKNIARLTGAVPNRMEALDSLVGIVPEAAITDGDAKAERLSRQ